MSLHYLWFYFLKDMWADPLIKFKKVDFLFFGITLHNDLLGHLSFSTWKGNCMCQRHKTVILDVAAVPAVRK